MDPPSPSLPHGAISSYSRIADLPVQIDGIRYQGIELPTQGGSGCRSLELVLSGAGCEGVGEDVTASSRTGPSAVLCSAAEAGIGVWRFEEYSGRLADTGLSGPRRWALESAGLALALEQAGRTLAEVLGRPLRPVRFVLSGAAGPRLELETVIAWHRRCREFGFTLDADESWDDEFLATLAAMERVEVVDFHSFERDPMPPAELYQRVSYALPNAILEDAALTEETRSLLLEHPGPLSWDAAIYSTIEIDALSPQAINVRPSRFGWWKRLLDAYDLCAHRDIRCYAGSSGEIGAGLEQLQYLASMFHPDAPNQVAPPRFQAAGPSSDLKKPLNPLPVSGFQSAFGRRR
ncbi:MAG: hypothetical protein H8E31_08655 [Planctomycetes bacterium]|nr:hypothetical protein [Planctomycetota bacterium]